MAEFMSEHSSELSSTAINDTPTKRPLETTKIFHICILGAKGTGKTTLCGQFTGKIARKKHDVHNLPNSMKALPSIDKPKIFKSVIHGNKSNLRNLKGISNAVDLFRTNILHHDRNKKRNNASKKQLSNGNNNTKGPLRVAYVVQLRDTPALRRVVSIDKLLNSNNVGSLVSRGNEECINKAESQPNNLLYLLKQKTYEEEIVDKFNFEQQEKAKKVDATRDNNYDSDEVEIDETMEDSTSNVTNSLYAHVSDRSWAYIIVFDPRYESTIEYAKTILKDMKTSMLQKRFEKATIILFANKYDLGDFTMNQDYRQMEKLAHELKINAGGVTLCHGSALNGTIFFHASPDVALRNYKLEHNITEFVHMIALEMKENSIYGQGDVQKYNTRLLASPDDMLIARIDSNDGDNEKDIGFITTLFGGTGSGVNSLIGCCGGNRE